MLHYDMRDPLLVQQDGQSMQTANSSNFLKSNVADDSANLTPTDKSSREARSLLAEFLRANIDTESEEFIFEVSATVA
jgi:hypothetical protein